MQAWLFRGSDVSLPGSAPRKQAREWQTDKEPTAGSAVGPEVRQTRNKMANRPGGLVASRAVRATRSATRFR